MAPVEEITVGVSRVAIDTEGRSWEKDYNHKCQKEKAAEDAWCVRCLFEKHEKDLSELKAKVGAQALTAPETGIDDLWLLRFVLSHPGNIAEAAEAVTTTLSWRREHPQFLKNVHDHHPAPKHNIITQFMVGGVHNVQADPTTILFMIRAGISDPKGLISHGKITEDELFYWLIHQRELLYMLCDRSTRQSGLLVKSTTIFDLSHLSIKKTLMDGAPPKPFEKAMGRASKLGEDMYPQLVDKTMFVNTPAVFAIFFAFFKRVANKKLMDKVVQPGNIVRDPSNPSPHAMDPAVLPTFLGGTCRCENGCVPGVSNDMKEPHPRK